MRSVSFVGPLPPPVNGFSTVCGMMLVRLQATMPVDVFDRAPNPRRKSLGVVKQLLSPARYLLTGIGRRNAVLYVALAGGRGQIIDLSYVLIGKLLRRPVYVHHHSFTYINAPTWLSRRFFAATRNGTHIVLSPNMGRSLVSAYGLDPDVVRVVSNAAFYELEQASSARTEDASPLRLGFLSNITLDKGIVEFFAILTELRRRGVPYRALIAGPLAPDTRSIFDELLRAAADVEYLGPVYGEEKETFYRNLDIFIFPTKYANEAEPLVVYEAMRRGAYVVACDRGAIAEMLGNGAGVALPREEIVQGAAARVERFHGERVALRAAQAQSASQAQRIQSSGRLELEELMSSMQNNISKPQGVNA